MGVALVVVVAVVVVEVGVGVLLVVVLVVVVVVGGHVFGAQLHWITIPEQLKQLLSLAPPPWI